MTEKQELINKYKEKGLEWCALRLYECRNNCKDKKEQIDLYRNERARLRREVKIAELIKHKNLNLAKVLEENGITPYKLTVYYKDTFCGYPSEGCPYIHECWPCEDCSNLKTSNIIEKTSWWVYKVTDGCITGIASNFESKQLECQKIINESTGEILFTLDNES